MKTPANTTLAAVMILTTAGTIASVSSCAPTPATDDSSSQAEPELRERSQPERPLKQQLQPQEQPAVVEEPEHESEPEPAPEPANTEPAAPSWWLTSIRQESDHTLIPGTADADSLRAARDAALATARRDAMRLAIDDEDETVLHAASATLADGSFRYWTIIRFENPDE